MDPSKPVMIPVEIIPRDSMGNGNINNAQDMARDLWEKATEILQEAGEVHAVAFLFSGTDCFLIGAQPFMGSIETKNMLREVILQAVAEKDAVGIAFVSETWMSLQKDGEQEIRPSEDPNKKHGLLVQCEWYNGTQYVLTATFTKVDSAIQIEEPTPAEHYTGRFSDIFPPPAGTLMN